MPRTFFEDLDVEQRKFVLIDLATALREQANRPQNNVEFQRVLRTIAKELESMADDIAETGTDTANAIINEAVMLLASVQKSLSGAPQTHTIH